MSATTTSTQNPWATQQPYLATGFATAQNLLNNKTPQYYAGSTVADPSAYRAPAMDAAWNLGAEGTPEMAALSAAGTGLLSGGAQSLNGHGAINNVAQGGMLTNQNPFFGQMVNQSIQAARPGMDAAFASTGRIGSGAHATAFADAATRIAGELGYKDYSAERGYMNQAQHALPQMDLAAKGAGAGMAQAANTDTFNRVGLLGNVADWSDKRAQNLVDADVARHNFGQTAPWDAAKQYMSLVGGGNFGRTTTETAPAGNEWLQWASVLSGLLK